MKAFKARAHMATQLRAQAKHLDAGGLGGQFGSGLGSASGLKQSL